MIKKWIKRETVEEIVCDLCGDYLVQFGSIRENVDLNTGKATHKKCEDDLENIEEIKKRLSIIEKNKNKSFKKQTKAE